MIRAELEGVRVTLSKAIKDLHISRALSPDIFVRLRDLIASFEFKKRLDQFRAD
jgi:hypothetical protein